MTGEIDLARLLAGLDPALDAVEYGFETVADAAPLGDAFALIREAEGVTRVGPGRGWARITLRIHSSLEAVGLTARVAEALAERGISRQRHRGCASRPRLRSLGTASRGDDRVAPAGAGHR